jgi:hypothetical protein
MLPPTGLYVVIDGLFPFLRLLHERRRQVELLEALRVAAAQVADEEGPEEAMIAWACLPVLHVAQKEQIQPSQGIQALFCVRYSQEFVDHLLV